MSSVPSDDTVVLDNCYTLKKRHPGCTGMFWRSDPTGTTKLASNDNWPRDDATVCGTPITDQQQQPWLLVSHIKQKNDTQWKVAPVGAALPFEYDNHYYLDKVASTQQS